MQGSVLVIDDQGPAGLAVASRLQGPDLRAEMKVPGRAWLQFEVKQNPSGEGSVIQQTAIFDPTGLFGLIYWYALYPLHGMVFQGMLDGIARAIEKR